MEERSGPKGRGPIDREQNESVADYVQRLHETTMGGVGSIAEAMKQDPVNLTRLINNIPDLIREAQQLSGKGGEKIQ